MQNTLKMMKKIITEESKKLTLEQLSEEYQKTLNPVFLAASFEKSFGLIIKISKKFKVLNDNDIASFSLEELDKCLQLWDKSKGTGFITFFGFVLHNRFREELKFLNKDKRKIIFHVDLLRDDFDKIYNEDYFDIKDYSLDEKEIKYCLYKLEGYSSREIANMMNVKTRNIYIWRKSIKQKFSLDMV